jgi:hypothetical protein
MNEHEYELVHTCTQDLLNGIAERALVNGIHPEELARRVLVKAFIALADANEAESFLLTLRKHPDSTWGSHTHYDYLDADPEHLKQDFYWERANSDANT